MGTEASKDARRERDRGPGRFAAALTGLGAIAFFAATMGRMHLGDATGYAFDAIAGNWFANAQHLLPRALGGLAYGFLQGVDPDISPFTAMTWTCILAGGIAVGCLVDLVRVLTGRTGLAVGCGVAFAVTYTTWRHGTSWEIHVQHVAAMLLATVLVIRSRSARRQLPMLAAAGACVGLAVGLHLVAVPAAVALGLAVLLRPGSPRARVSRGVVLAGCAVLALELACLPGYLSGSRNQTLALAQIFAEPQRFSPLLEARHPALAERLDGLLAGARFSVHAGVVPVVTPLLDALLLGWLLLAPLGLLRLPSLWRRHQEAALLPLIWVPLQLIVIWRVEAENVEYYVAILAMAALWTALLLDDVVGRRPRVLLAVPATALVLLLAANAGPIWSYRDAPYGWPAGVAKLGETGWRLYDGRGTQVVHEGDLAFVAWRPHRFRVFVDRPDAMSTPPAPAVSQDPQEEREPASTPPAPAPSQHPQQGPQHGTAPDPEPPNPHPSELELEPSEPTIEPRPEPPRPRGSR